MSRELAKGQRPSDNQEPLYGVSDATGTSPLSRLGRYEVVGTLASGGMAEILLGKMSGPSGFERLVVIKRILPHYASLPGFRDMFLDEARIAASIHHDNVVQHHELGQSEGELFLVMDYLEGEVLSGVRRRARSRGVLLAPEVSAYIVAEACAGLHAAHELVSLDGVAQDVVHRDVSPHNIFVTYDGAIKVIDFGIAKAASRITQTEAGQLKGKFSYMSPEQAGGEELDRRSDIFSLGIVLYELLSGRRLFRRATHASTLASILECSIPPLEKLAPSCPRSLIGITERALDKDREGRFSTSHDMRRALLRTIQEFAPSSLPQDILTTHMDKLFHERREEKREMLRRAREEECTVVDIPPSEVDLEIDIPEVPFLATDKQSIVKTKRRIIGLVAIGVILIAGIGFVLSASSSLWPPPASSLSPPATSSHQPPASSLAVHLVFETDPPGALVELDGEAMGVTPVTVQTPRSTESVQAKLLLEDYSPRIFTLTASTDQRLYYTLEPSPSKGSGQDRSTKKRRGSPRKRPTKAKQPEREDWSKVRF